MQLAQQEEGGGSNRMNKAKFKELTHRVRNKCRKCGVSVTNNSEYCRTCNPSKVGRRKRLKWT